MRRRQFLRRTGAIATGATRVAATHGPPLVSTREHFADDGSLRAGHTATGYDTDGYGGTVVGYTWDNDAGGGADFGWGEAQTVARNNGAKLAQFALDFALACGTTVRFVSHSLGAQVVLGALRELDADPTWNDFGFRVWSVHLQGAAQDNEAPTMEWPATFDAVHTETTATFNYHSEADDVLQWIYNSFEFDQALGETGKEDGNTAPHNYTDFDATGRVGDDHSSYMTNLADEIVFHMENASSFA